MFKRKKPQHEIEFVLRQMEGLCGPRTKLISPKHGIVLAKHMYATIDKSTRLRIIDVLTKFEANLGFLADQIKAADKLLDMSSWIEIDIKPDIIKPDEN